MSENEEIDEQDVWLTYYYAELENQVSAMLMREEEIGGELRSLIATRLIIERQLESMRESLKDSEVFDNYIKRRAVIENEESAVAEIYENMTRA